MPKLTQTLPIKVTQWTKEFLNSQVKEPCHHTPGRRDGKPCNRCRQNARDRLEREKEKREKGILPPLEGETFIMDGQETQIGRKRLASDDTDSEDEEGEMGTEGRNVKLARIDDPRTPASRDHHPLSRAMSEVSTASTASSANTSNNPITPASHGPYTDTYLAPTLLNPTNGHVLPPNGHHLNGHHHHNIPPPKSKLPPPTTTKSPSPPRPASTDPNQSIITLHAKNISIRVPKSFMQKSGYFCALFNPASQSPPTTLEVNPPTIRGFIDCLNYLGGERINPDYFHGAGLIDILRNADYLQISSLIDECFARFPSQWQEVITSPTFSHSTFRIAQLEHFLASLPPGTPALDKARILLSWSRNWPKRESGWPILDVARRYIIPDASWNVESVNKLRGEFGDLLDFVMPATLILAAFGTKGSEVLAEVYAAQGVGGLMSSQQVAGMI